LRDQFPFALETTIEKRGLIFTDKVAVVRSKKTREVVAEVKMDTQGFFFVERIAVATNIKTKEKYLKHLKVLMAFSFLKEQRQQGISVQIKILTKQEL